MKATLGPIEIVLPEEIIDKIAQRVVECLKLYLSSAPVEDSLLTVDQAAVLLQRSKGTIYELVNDSKHGLGTFPYLKQGRRLRFSRRALLSWGAENGCG